MKLLTKIVLWWCLVNMVLACLMCLFGIAMIATGNQTLPQAEEGVMTVFFSVGLAVAGCSVIFHVNTIRCLNQAKQKSDVPTWRKVMAFFLSTPLAGILLCCLSDKAFAKGKQGANNN